MHLFNKRGEAQGFSVVIGMILGLVLIAFVIGLLLVVRAEALNKETFQQTGCWLTNNVKCTGGILSDLPTLCLYDIVEEPADVDKVASLIRSTWWMYMRNGCDFGNAGDEAYPAYAFTPKEDIILKDFFNNITSENRGKETDIEHSDYAYLEGETEGNTLCFDKKYGDSISESILEKGEEYYIIYYDDQFPHDQGDMIIISGDPEFTGGYANTAWWEYLLAFWVPSTAQAENVYDHLFDPTKGACVNYGSLGEEE